MTALYGKENLTQLIEDSRVGPGTVTRIKGQETSVGIDVLEKIAAALGVEPWHLLHPNLSDLLEQKAAPLPANQHPIDTKNVAHISNRRSADSVESALRVLADAVRPLKPSDRDGIAALLGSFGRDPDSHVVLASLLAGMDSANARRQTDVPLQSCSSN